MGVSKPTVHCWIVALTIQAHFNSLKSILMEENKWSRLEMAMSFVDPVNPTNFQDMLGSVLLDEKWFLLTSEKERYLFLPEEKEPTHYV